MWGLTCLGEWRLVIVFFSQSEFVVCRHYPVNISLWVALMGSWKQLVFIVSLSQLWAGGLLSQGIVGNYHFPSLHDGRLASYVLIGVFIVCLSFHESKGWDNEQTTDLAPPSHLLSAVNLMSFTKKSTKLSNFHTSVLRINTSSESVSWLI